ncbi:uncharacterized protein F5891DRAFT_1023774 [Suillus fuscotomentosus]|uniref:Uncharacterized protein n=1 Tax=Suillus fuscotomentosus TaxID=1912939 RepID=A0AAD4EAI2_9AGAM|nr:uncharacterized protein F5891DRAFT_1023774 [Suillus fuscotomentosus]KAG1902371.1 hypothetical protein F5891DRAFT_1023774 [Suillus fuscotomentosus]
MASLSLKEPLLRKLVTLVKHLKLLKLSVILLCRIHRHVITFLRRLLHGISYNHDSHLQRQILNVDRIMGATQPAVGGTQDQISVTTLAVRPPEREDAPSQHCVGSPLAFPLPQVPMDHLPYSAQTSSAVPNVRQPGAITLRPIIASQIGRYERNITQSKDFRVFEVSPGPNNFTESSMPVANWLQLTHPEGARFFFNSHQRVFTDQNILENDLALDILAAAEQANRMAAESGNFCATMELAIEKLSEGVFGYYFVDHEARIIFWPEIVRSRELMIHVRGVSEKNHIRYALEAQYWKHCTLFSNMRALPRQTVNCLRDIIAYAHAESITSQTSLSPFDLDELSNILSVVDQVKDNIEKVNEHSVCIVARYLDMFFRAKFVNFCGQLGARLDADRSLYDSNSKKPHPIFIRILNVVLFNSPAIHSESLHNIWVDNTVVKPRWKKFISQLNSEWNSFTVFSTVMLAVDVSFLTVPGVDDPSVQSKPAVTIVIYLSTLCAMGSLVISLILAGQVSDNRRSSADSVAKFISSMSKSLLGIESLALMLSLPFALLIWGMIFFAIALSILIFYTTDIVALTVVIPIWAVVLLLSTWPVLAANNLHVSVVGRRAIKYWKDIMQNIIIIRRQ